MPYQPAVEVRECGDAAAGLFDRLRSAAAERPELVFACAGLLPAQAQRDRVLADAFQTAIARKPDVARQNLAAVVDKPWTLDAGYFPVASFAISIAARNPSEARALLLQAAARYPALALREYRTYWPLPFGREVFEQAAMAAPDEAAGLAGGKSVTAEDVLLALRSSGRPELQVLAKMAPNPKAGVFFRRVAAGQMSFERAMAIAGGAAFFPEVAKLRVGASGSDAAMYDRVLENHSEVLFRETAELRGLSARDLYLALSYGRTEEDDLQFESIFDGLLLPKLGPRGVRPSKLLDEVRDLQLRRFLGNTVAHHRLDAFLGAEGTAAAQAELLARAVQGIQTLDETLAAAEVVAAVSDPGRLRRLQREVMAGYERGGPPKALYGLLAAAVVRRVGGDAGLEKIAKPYQGYFQESKVLDVGSLFAGKVCLQQHFFYDDDDANESFDSFRQAYQQDRAWKWEDHGWYVRVSGTGASGRRIVIYANVPHSAKSLGGEDRRHALNALMQQAGLTPTVVVHRGHTWYVDQSLRYLTPRARLVYLGSCRGMESAYSVIALANQAQMIATRGVGTIGVNDPLLKGLNDELLRGGESLDWERFWAMQQARLGGNPQFQDYIPPPRNAGAIMLSAYYAYLAAGN